MRLFLPTPSLGLGRQFLIALVGTIWLALAGLIVAQATGMTDISPMSGMSLIGVTLMFFLSGGNVVPAIILGVAVCIGIGQCADMMGDLKSGHLIGAKPKTSAVGPVDGVLGWRSRSRLVPLSSCGVMVVVLGLEMWNCRHRKGLPWQRLWKVCRQARHPWTNM